ncbi:ThiF family adenylyltransferase [Enterovirga aerilata]|uniref:THIF-type NAD/FAD binding fold domain-containing protein n=1 Tax=Enterovirga aerilata TaxID=2730920 RepID=A0A849IBN9_9HYPH|nr:ThiF family adenylyltransferase [Enterovirga sp. DB1703]NNM73839.1 hypothetical protein [Enterovirga sp. DB1703]
MTAHVHPLPVDAVALVDSWFSPLKSFRGRLPSNDPLIAAGGAGWLIRTRGRELAVVVDVAFPFTRPRVYLRGNWPAMPHIERDGRFCLRNPEIPASPIAAVERALGEARALLADIASGSEDHDFEEDFGLYWRQSAEVGLRARLLIPGDQASSIIAWSATQAGAYGFLSTEALQRWWAHRFDSDRSHVRQGALVALTRLPHPDLYPRTGLELWDLVVQCSRDGAEVLAGLLRQTPKSLLVVLAGTALSGRHHAVGAMLTRHSDARGRPVTRRVIEHDYPRGKTPPEIICERYRLSRLETEALDAAGTRLPYEERDRLASARVAVIGCGALGSGVARLLAKSGVGHLVLVDPERLGWENIRRHQLGAGFVGSPKATGLAKAIAHENPDIGGTIGYDLAVEKLLLANAKSLEGLDLVVACTASWSANSALDDFFGRPGRPPVLYAWMEAHAVAAHAVLIMTGNSYRSGFDIVGNPKLMASQSSKAIPAACGALTSPFGAIELAHAETLTSRLALDFLRGKAVSTTWRTWLTDSETLADAEGSWTKDWIAARGSPDPQGQVSAGPWLV